MDDGFTGVLGIGRYTCVAISFCFGRFSYLFVTGFIDFIAGFLLFPFYVMYCICNEDKDVINSILVSASMLFVY